MTLELFYDVNKPDDRAPTKHSLVAHIELSDSPYPMCGAAGRFVIIASSLSNDYLPFAWQNPFITWADWGIRLGSFGWFGMYFILFARTFPVVAIQELKEMIPMPRRKKGGAH